jgi:hypothetical protein
MQRLAGCMAALGRFIARSGQKALPFFKLMKRTGKFEWTPEADKAFVELKRYLTSPPIMVAPMFREPLLLYIAATLTREQGCIDAQSIRGKISPRSRKAKHGGITEDQRLVSNPHKGARMRRCTKHPQEDFPLSRKAKRGRIIEDQGRFDHLAKEMQIRRSALGPSPREQPLTRCRRSLGSLKRRRFHVREGPASLNDEEGPVNRHARQFALSCWHR